MTVFHESRSSKYCEERRMLLPLMELIKAIKRFSFNSLTKVCRNYLSLTFAFSAIIKRGNIPDSEFLLSVHDCIQTVNAEHTYRGPTFQESNPIFTIVSCNFSDNIPFPMWEGNTARGGGLSEWDSKMEMYKRGDDTHIHTCL